jgi:hypothetical protein
MKNSYYFPHDYHARHDPKLEKLRMELGPVADGIFWDLVEMLYEEEGYLLVKDIPLYAKMLNTDEHMLNKVITELFLTEGDRFYNQSLLDRLAHITAVREERRQAGELSGKSRQRNKCSASVEQLGNNIKERKVKESKVNKKLKPLDFAYLEPTNVKALLKTYGGREEVANHLRGMGFYDYRIVEALEKANAYEVSK